MKILPSNQRRRHNHVPATSPLQEKLFRIIFEADTGPGKTFDILLILTIVASVLVVMLDSVSSIAAVHHRNFYLAEWIFTFIFTIEYFLRIYCVRRKSRYILSFYGMIDLLAIIPTYLSLMITGSQYLLIIRILRLLRIFRVLKLVQYLSEADILITALKDSSKKITVFLFTVVIIVVILGSLMYVIEGEDSGFTSIPKSIYWAVITLTTVGYGDIVPVTPLGQGLAAVIMIMGYSIIAIPTGIVTHSIMSSAIRPEVLQISRETKKVMLNVICPGCGSKGHEYDADYCKYCGTKLYSNDQTTLMIRDSINNSSKGPQYDP